MRASQYPPTKHLLTPGVVANISTGTDRYDTENVSAILKYHFAAGCHRSIPSARAGAPSAALVGQYPFAHKIPTPPIFAALRYRARMVHECITGDLPWKTD